MEVERKFLVDELPAGLQEHHHEDLRQGYLAIGADRSEARVRAGRAERWLTVKRGSGLERAEFEVQLTTEQFDRLWPATEGRRIEKTRYRLPADGSLVIELDVYHGPLEGLAVAEIEFPDRAAAESFRAPAWLGREVTDDGAYKNASLATRGVPPDAPGSRA